MRRRPQRAISPAPVTCNPLLCVNSRLRTEPVIPPRVSAVHSAVLGEERGAKLVNGRRGEREHRDGQRDCLSIGHDLTQRRRQEPLLERPFLRSYELCIVLSWDHRYVDHLDSRCQVHPESRFSDRLSWKATQNSTPPPPRRRRTIAGFVC